MPIFKKKQETAVVAPKEAAVATIAPRRGADLSGVLIRPRITEKSAAGHEAGRYVFDVRTDATVSLVAAAVKAIYKVSPRKVNIVPVPSKRVFVRGRRGVKTGGKKAYVFLKKGDTIELA